MDILTLIVLLPLAGFVVNGLGGTALGRQRIGPSAVSVIGCGLPIASFLLAIGAIVDLERSGQALVDVAYTWTTVGTTAFEVAFRLDRLSAVMLLVVTGVGSLIHVYSTGYMKDDPGYARFFAYLNLFLFFMLLLVLGKSLLVVFVGWEGVGLASYLLIGFWFDDPAKAAAGSKAFITNRIGDAGFLVGMFLLQQGIGTLDIETINAAFANGAPPGLSATLVALALFVGATGKSAQIPLHVWLPDAMAGPTPVSALIHAATMVTAGVYMTARMSPIYLASLDASQIVAWTGLATAFFAATVAVTQYDIKKVLAYSTISQLGLMFVAIGVGAYGVAVFHVVTHAFFKACLFLGAGSVIHALGGEQDVRRMGGLARRIPVTFATFAIATAAIAGIPPLAGFFSKDEILWFALASGHGGSVALFALATLTALLTAFYMFRLLWLTFFGASRLSPQASHHVHESPVSMTGVLTVLAVLSAVGGFLAVPHYLEPTLPLPDVRAGTEALHVVVVALSVAVAFAGLAAAAWCFGNLARADALRNRFVSLHRVLSAKYYVDEAYDALLGRPLAWISDRVFLRLGDRVLLDGSLNGLAALARRGALVLGRVQAGPLQLYALFAVAGLILSLAWMLRHG